jgi:hypothetical protein
MLIGLCGKPQSGKSEVRYILERLGFCTINTKRSLALACHELTGIPHAQFLTQEGKDSLYKGVPLRKIMGKVQDSLEELFGDYHTIENALEQSYYLDDHHYVLDSLRKTQPLHFPGIVVEVYSPRGIVTGNAFDEYDTSKISWVINNIGSFSDLEREVAIMLDKLGIRL